MSFPFVYFVKNVFDITVQLQLGRQFNSESILLIYLRNHPDILDNLFIILLTVLYFSFSLEIRCIGVKWPMDEMADGQLGQGLNDRWPFGWAQVAKLAISDQ